MRVVDSALLLAGIASSATAANVPRALPNAPNGYAPANVTCPETRPSIRSASKLSPNETAWQQVRLNSTTQAMKDFFSAVKIADFDAVKFLNGAAAGQPPNVAIAVSGGGYRAMLTGAGVVKAFDSRSDGQSAPASTGGVLQSSTYLAGLSGGSWLVASIYANNFTTISALQDDAAGEAWQLGRSITEGPSSGPFGSMNTSTYLMNVVEQVNEKAKAGFNTTVTDAWARMLSFQFINATDGGPAYTWSSFALDSRFTSGNMPMPLVVACAQTPQVNGLSLNLTTIEFTPFEFGSWDPSINGFAPMEYLGSSFDGGDIPSSGSCVRGFDDVGFVLGTSSSLFNEMIGTSLAASLLTPLTGLFGTLGMIFDKADEYVAEYVNPFFNWKQSSAAFSGVRSLNLFDGGENSEVIPFQPLIQPERKVDVIFAVDVGGDTTYGWPNGSSLRATYERTVNKLNVGQGASFPSVPDANTFVNLGLNTRPTFFGCNSSNFSTATPLVVYLPNYPYTTASNTSTFDLSYNNSQRDAMILNGYQIATMGNGTRDSNWSTCVGCAMLSRSFDRTNTTVPAACASCFQAYCWDGTINSTTPAPYDPAIGFTSTINSGNSTGTSTSSTQSASSATGSSAADSATVPSVVVSVLSAVLALFVSM